LKNSKRKAVMNIGKHTVKAINKIENKEENAIEELLQSRDYRFKLKNII
jgi:hypothetical protein